MPIFKFKARDKYGNLIQNKIEADDLTSAKKFLLQNNLFLLEIGMYKNFAPSQFFDFFQPTVSLDELIIFTRQLQLIYAVRMPLLKGLQFLFNETGNPLLREAIKGCMAEISEGKEFSQALGKYPKIFDKSYISLVRAGEASGELDAILERICEITETKAANAAKIKSALFYPKIVVGFMGFLFFIEAFLIIPKMQGFYDNLKIDLPLVTRIVLKLSAFVTSPYFLLFDLVCMLLFFYFHTKILSYINKIWTNVSLRLPFLGLLLIQIEMNSFCKILELLLKSGLSFTKSLEVLKDIAVNEHVATDIEQLRQKVEAGKSIKDSIGEGRYFPSLLVNMMAIGEETGSIEIVLNRTANFYRQQIEGRISTLTKVIEPVLLGVIFISVLVLALSVFLPMWKMSSAIKN